MPFSELDGGEMRLILLLMALLLLPLPLMAETYTWVDGRGTVNFTDDFSNVPPKYRKKVNKLGGMGGQPDPALRDTDAAAGKSNQPRPSQAHGEPRVSADTAEVWQQEFRTRTAEVKRLDQQFERFEELMKKPIGIPRDRAAVLSQEFQELRRAHDEAVKRYNELNDAANKAGLPIEFRK
jgi:hypothetical protein